MKKSESKYFNTAVRMDRAFLELLEKKDMEYITVKEIQHALKLMSKPLTEWVNAPTEMKSTPHSA